jgi:lysophospholipase L1-like esterase
MAVIGDSHAVLLMEGWMPSARVVRSGRSTTVLYLGPRLLHSVAREGFPPWVLRLLTARRRSPLARGPLTAVLTLGEIDLRCHLAKPGRGDADSLAALVEDYLVRVRDLLPLLGRGGRVVLCGPNPPSVSYESEDGFPVVGSVEERAAILDRLCSTLDAAVRALGDPAVRFVDVRAAVGDASGLLREDLTFDGCHLNSTGSAIVRAMLDDLDAT